MAWALRCLAGTLLVVLLSLLVVLSSVPAVPAGSSSVADSATAAPKSDAHVTVTVIPDYVPDEDVGWQEPSPVPVWVHVAWPVVLLSVLLALRASRRTSTRGAPGLANQVERRPAVGSPTFGQ